MNALGIKEIISRNLFVTLPSTENDTGKIFSTFVDPFE